MAEEVPRFGSMLWGFRLWNPNPNQFMEVRVVVQAQTDPNLLPETGPRSQWSGPMTAVDLKMCLGVCVRVCMCWFSRMVWTCSTVQPSEVTPKSWSSSWSTWKRSAWTKWTRCGQTTCPGDRLSPCVSSGVYLPRRQTESCVSSGVYLPRRQSPVCLVVSTCPWDGLSPCVSTCPGDGLSPCVSTCPGDGLSPCVSTCPGDGLSPCMSTCSGDGLSPCVSSGVYLPRRRSESCVSSGVYLPRRRSESCVSRGVYLPRRRSESLCV